MRNFFRTFADRLLSSASIFRWSQRILAPGADKYLTKALAEALTQIPTPRSSLDIGCGPASWLWRIGLRPVGLDISREYVEAFKKAGGETAIVGSADNLPFDSETFDSIWTVGVFHHLDGDTATRSIAEMKRVCRTNGHVVFCDAVMPSCAWLKPLAYVIRKADRGKFMRYENDLRKLVGEPQTFISRKTYSYLGLELMILIWRKTATPLAEGPQK